MWYHLPWLIGLFLFHPPARYPLMQYGLLMHLGLRSNRRKEIPLIRTIFLLEDMNEINLSLYALQITSIAALSPSFVLLERRIRPDLHFSISGNYSKLISVYSHFSLDSRNECNKYQLCTAIIFILSSHSLPTRIETLLFPIRWRHDSFPPPLYKICRVIAWIAWKLHFLSQFLLDL